MKVLLLTLGLLSAPLAIANSLGIQTCSEAGFKFENIWQVRGFDGRLIHMYLVKKNNSRGLAVTYGAFCRYISGYFETDLNKAVATSDRAKNIFYVQALIETEDSSKKWMTVQIKKAAPDERAAIHGWIH